MKIDSVDARKNGGETSTPDEKNRHTAREGGEKPPRRTKIVERYVKR
jgi:hypothetical protein